MSESGSERRPGGFQWPVALLLTAVWVLLWGSLSAATVLSGLVVSVIVLAVFPLPPIVFGGWIHPVGLGRLIGRFAVDLFVASFEVSTHVLRFGSQPANAVVKVELYNRSDVYMTLTAELVSLVPGSLVVEARRSAATLFIHVLGVRDDADVERARRRALEQEERVMNALASKSELAAYYDRKRQGERR